MVRHWLLSLPHSPGGHTFQAVSPMAPSPQSVFRSSSRSLGTGGTVAFTYDPFGRRIQKSSTSGTTIYLYDGASTIEEVDQSGSVLARYAQSGAVDEPLAEQRSGSAVYYQQDGLGSVTSLSGTTGTISNSYTYDAFGNLNTSTGTTANPFQYTGRDYDSETGLRYYRARYYDSQWGRFLSENPIGFRGGRNFYRYAANNPINRRDPTGLFPIIDCIKCLYYTRQCTKEGTQCRKDLDEKIS
jgi:RHS repeat-associated protein